MLASMMIAKASSFGRYDCSRLCIGHTIAMTKSAQATGANTELATRMAAKIAITAITPTTM
jgi:hypothetical protein